MGADEQRRAPGGRGAAGRLRDGVTALLVVAGLGVAAVGGWQWWTSAGGDPVDALVEAVGTTGPATGEAALPQARPAPSRPGAPRELAVPSLGIDAPVDPVAAPGGVLTPPADATRLGWWAAGARPGGRGSVLVAGHTVSSGGGALDDLERVRPGEMIEVGTASGRTAYEVVRVEVLGKGELARRSERIFDQEVPGRLVLVTCEDWDGRAYRSNVVVTARPRR